MRKATLVGLVFAVVMASTTLAPAPAAADGGHRFRGHGPRLHSAPPKHFPPPRHFAPRFGSRRHFRGHKAPFAVAAPPVIIYAPPAPVYAPPVYAPAPVYVPAPPAYPPAVSYAPTERVVEFETGRYELHGDGITVPYRWVWIPKAPVAPPPEAEPATPDPPAVDPSSAPSAAPERTRPIEVYRWTDDNGVVHLTDRLENVPEAYRTRVTKSQSVSVRKGQQ